MPDREQGANPPHSSIASAERASYHHCLAKLWTVHLGDRWRVNCREREKEKSPLIIIKSINMYERASPYVHNYTYVLYMYNYAVVFN